MLRTQEANAGSIEDLACAIPRKTGTLLSVGEPEFIAFQIAVFKELGDILSVEIQSTRSTWTGHRAITTGYNRWRNDRTFDNTWRWRHRCD